MSESHGDEAEIVKNTAEERRRYLEYKIEDETGVTYREARQLATLVLALSGIILLVRASL